MFDQLNLVRPRSHVNVDHSDMRGLTALVGAVQTRNGRAIPCFVETTYAQHRYRPTVTRNVGRGLGLQWCWPERRSLSLASTIDALQDFADRLGFWPRLVFDRGFGNESIVTHLAAEGCTFYIRFKAGRFVEFDEQRA